MTIRPMEAGDVEALQTIQAVAQEAAQWNPIDYLQHFCTVAEVNGTLVGFIVWRRIAGGEQEILNVATTPAWRRRGVAKGLLVAAIQPGSGDWYLEVRKSNEAAIGLYKSFGFSTVGERPAYYTNPTETGIVMKLRS